MSTTSRLVRLAQRIGEPLSLRYTPDHRVGRDDGIRSQKEWAQGLPEGVGSWVVVIDKPHRCKHQDASARTTKRDFDGLYAAHSPADAIRGAEKVVERRLHQAAAKMREEDDGA